MKKSINSIILCTATLFVLSLQSCSDLLDQFQDNNRNVLHFDFNGFESVSTRSGEDQFSISSGDMMYLDFDEFHTYATYSSVSTWSLNDVPPTTSSKGKLNAFYAKPSMTSSDVCLSGAGSFTNTKNGVTASVTLSPLTARLRFKGDAGEDVSINGLDYYNSFNTSSYEFTRSNGEEIKLRVAGDGYTPYVYVMFSGTSEIRVTYNGKTAVKTFKSDVLQPGRSGCLNLANLQFESEGDWTDVTGLIANPSFDGNNYFGWEGTPWGAAYPEGNAEHWNKIFDTYQVLHDLQPGMYRLSVQGFYRMGSYRDDYGAYYNGSFISYPTLYAKSSLQQAETGFCSVSSAALSYSLGGNSASVGDAYYVPNDMRSAHYWFEAGYYNVNSVTCQVGDDGELTIGVSKSFELYDDWLCVDNWKLEYQGQYEKPLSTSDYSADVDNAFHLTTDNITSPYTEPTEGSIAAMLDKDPATFWHSIWTDHEATPTELEDGHYFQIEEPDLTGNFAFGFTRRNIASDQISQWAVYGVPSDNPNATKSQCQLLARVSTPVSYNTESYISPVIQNPGFKTIRFYAEQIVPTYRVYFHLAEFRLYPAKQGAGIVGSIDALPNDGTDHNGHEYVDLGLSVKWATCNVGASSPEDYGDYFAWGETEPKTWYARSTYKWYNESEYKLTKYCFKSPYGYVDNKYTLDPEDDAAHVNWGGSWRMPTKAEQDELLYNCTWTWTTQNGVPGYKVTSQKNANSIFLPAAGEYYFGDLISAGSSGSYYSSSLADDGWSNAYSLIFLSGVTPSSGDRSLGLSVRAVCP